uniref:Uncharacterized protein n=1 Tax=Spumella elongata TaxID=89044 RepID=A0A7S3HUF0_9STRA|mmetsp:Transcript_9063/g.15501  ORF Transcript_9063/g.15501 Transcript_9063/m.15501 type:complete len:186 (+) Transcript_9063:587-1144(+)
MSPTSTGISSATSVLAAAASVVTNQPSTWLAGRLRLGGMFEALILDCEQRLVYTEGFSSERDLAECAPAEFDRAYLRSIGITAMGVQVQLIRLQSELHAQYAQQAKATSSVPAQLPPTPPPSQSTLFSGNAHVVEAQGLIERMEKCSFEPTPALGFSQDPVFVASQLDDPNEDPVYVEPPQQQRK